MNVRVNIQLAKLTTHTRRGGCNLRDLIRSDALSTQFCARFCEEVKSKGAADNLSQHAHIVAEALQTASQTIGQQGPVAGRPWISSHTLRLIAERNRYRQLNDPVAERRLHKEIRSSVKRDRQAWLDEEMAGGPWSIVKAFCKGAAKKPIQIRDNEHKLVDSDVRGDTLADYFEKVQWRVTFAELNPSGSDVLGDALPVNTSQFDLSELRAALKTLAAGKAAGGDDVPPEFWKVLQQSDDAMHELLHLCQACWSAKDLPEQWRVGTVVLLYKKGNASLPENYRPITLLPVGYKVVASMLQKRLQQGGAEQRIRQTQYGFRPGRSAVQAITIARRMFDAAYASASPGMIALMLDWAKAFDRIKPDAMMIALRRFGIPGPVLDMVSSIYRLRQFVLKDPCGDSTLRVQRAGIAQGCPLSPYLFILMQTVLQHDVDQRMREALPHTAEPDYIVCSDVLYADDTMLVSSSALRLQLHMDTLVDEGQRYGLELNWSKTVAMRINHEGQLVQPSGEPVRFVAQAVYLGGLLSTTTSAKSEVTRRIGEAKGTFKALQRCWSHANVTRQRKIELYQACVVSKVMYNLESLWLLQADVHRLDAFHVKCLRVICRIPCSYISRITNQHVLEVAGQHPLSELLRDRQQKLYRQIAQSPETSLLKKLTCEPGSDLPRRWAGKRRRGRPKQQWAACVFAQLAL